jgi:hypothetical protein
VSFAANPARGEVVVAAGADATVTGSGGGTAAASRQSAGGIPVGRLLSGKDVRKVGSTWQWIDGTPLELGGYLDANTGQPPLSPKPQPAARTASAGSIRKIAAALGQVSECRDDVGGAFTGERFDVDERGIARVSYSRNGQAHIQAMPAGRMDFSATPRLDGSCWKISIRCNDGSWCGENGIAPDGSTASGLLFFANTPEQLSAITAALKEIAPNFRDTTPDIHVIQ